MKIIAIDGNEANIENRVGVNQFAYEVINNFVKLQDEWINKYRIVVYLKNTPLDDMPKETNYFKYKVIKGNKMWIITKLMPELYLSSPKPDILFTPSHYIPPFSPIPCICSIMDLGYLNYSEHFRKIDYWQLKYWSAWSINRSKKIIAISKFTADDIVRHYPKSKNKIKVTPLGYDHDKFNTSITKRELDKVKIKYNLSNYILFLSTLKPSKNIERLIEAFAMIVKNENFISNSIKLVIAGKKGWLYQTIFKKVKDLGLEKSVIFTGFISEKEKPALFRGAKIFVLPSLWEGYGLDVLSAMACGIPIVVSNLCSLPEIVGQTGILIDPYDQNSLAQALLKILLMDKNEYNKLVNKELIRVKGFSWEKTAREILAVIESTI